MALEERQLEALREQLENVLGIRGNLLDEVMKTIRENQEKTKARKKQLGEEMTIRKQKHEQELLNQVERDLEPLKGQLEWVLNAQLKGGLEIFKGKREWFLKTALEDDLRHRLNVRLQMAQTLTDDLKNLDKELTRRKDQAEKKRL